LLSSNSFSTCPHNMVNFGPLTTDIGLPVWGTPAKFQRVSRLAFVTAATSLSGGQLNFARYLTVSCAVILYIHFRGLLPLTEFYQVQNSFYAQVLRLLYWQRYCTAGHSGSGRQPNFAAWYKEWNYGSFAEGATYIFGSAAIRLGIDPHSSSYCIQNRQHLYGNST